MPEPLYPDKPDASLGASGIVVDGIDYRPLMGFIRANVKTIAVAFLVAALLTCLSFFLGQKHYASEAFLAPKKNESSVGSSLAASARQILSSEAADDSPDYLQLPSLLLSASLAGELSKNQKFLHVAFSDRWNAEIKRWKSSGEATAQIKTWLGYQIESSPGIYAVAALLKTNLTLKPDTKENYYRLTYRATDASAAQEVLTEVIRTADSILRERSIADSQRRVDFIQKKLKETQSVEQHQVLGDMLARAENSLAIANSDINFSFDYIDSPTKPYKPDISISDVILRYLLFFIIVFGILYSFSTFKIRYARHLSIRP